MERHGGGHATRLGEGSNVEMMGAKRLEEARPVIKP